MVGGREGWGAESHAEPILQKPLSRHLPAHHSASDVRQDGRNLASECGEERRGGILGDAPRLQESELLSPRFLVNSGHVGDGKAGGIVLAPEEHLQVQPPLLDEFLQLIL